MGGKYKHRRKSTASDDEQPVSPGKARGSKRRKTTHVEDVRTLGAYYYYVDRMLTHELLLLILVCLGRNRRIVRRETPGSRKRTQVRPGCLGSPHGSRRSRVCCRYGTHC